MSRRQAAKQPPIIDMHMHANVPDIPASVPVPSSPEPRPDGRIPASSGGQGALHRTLAQMKRHNVVKGFLSGDKLETLSEWKAADPDGFIAAPLIWMPGTPSVDLLRREVSAGHLSGMGEIATQYNGFAPNDPALEPYFELAEELRLPTLIHTLGFGAPLPGFRCASGSPLFLEPVLVKHPNLRLYVENAGYPFFAEMTAKMYQYPQLYADVSTITWIMPREGFHDYLKALVRAGLGKRLMFGSDQMQWPETIGLAIEAIESADFLTVEQKRDIFYNNAARFLRWDTATQ